MRMLRRLFLIFLVLYIGTYAWLRHSGTIVHLEKKSGAQPHFVGVKDDAGDKMAVKMADESEQAVMKTRGAWGETKAILLNTLFWPLCTAESAFWKMRQPR